MVELRGAMHARAGAGTAAVRGTALANAEPGMRILVEPGSYTLENLGDVAMMQVALGRLTELWPGATLAVVTRHPERLARFCPGIEPVLAPVARGRLVDPSLFAWAYRLIPGPLARTVRRWEQRFAERRPAALLSWLELQARLTGGPDPKLRRFAGQVGAADLVVVSGMGALTDAFAARAANVLVTVELAGRRGIPCVMFSQGIGPLRGPAFTARVAAACRRVELMAVRERLSGPGLLASLGICPDRVLVTGDDAIALAYAVRPPQAGGELGVNVRATSYTGLGDAALRAIRPAVHRAAAGYGAEVVPFPISHRHGGVDARTNRTLLAELAPDTDGGASLDTPLKVIHQIARCRLVVTSSYHGAVFAMAQGIPAVAVVNSQYYENKFRGLADIFGGGCEIVSLGLPRFTAALSAAIDRAWMAAPGMRDPLLDAAVRQIAHAREAYARLLTLCGARGLRARAPEQPLAAAPVAASFRG